MIQHKTDIDIAGMINAERKSATKILLPIKEALHNSLEAIRLARLEKSSIKGIIKIIFNLKDDYLNEWIVFDNATELTGIKNLNNKNIYKLYYHEGDKNGFSEYGIGSKIENLRCCDYIEHHTITSSGIYEKSEWNIQESIKRNSLLEVIKYEINPVYKDLLSYMDDGYSTASMVLCKNILPRLKDKITTNYIKNIDNDNESLFLELCSHLVKYDSENIDILFIVNENNKEIIKKKICSQTILGNYIKTFVIFCCEDKKTKEQQSFILNDELDNYNNLDNSKDFEFKSLENINLKKNPKFINYYNHNIMDSLKRAKGNDITYDNLNKKYNIISKIKVYCSTADIIKHDDGNIKNTDKTGFYGIREVTENNIVCTTMESLTLKWNIFKSHRTRYIQFRGIIHYDTKSDHLLMSDKSKSLSDDRDFDKSLRFNILKLTDCYFTNMRSKYKQYDTEKDKKKEILEDNLSDKKDIDNKIFSKNDKIKEIEEKLLQEIENEKKSKTKYEENILKTIPIKKNILDDKKVIVKNEKNDFSNKEIPHVQSEVVNVTDDETDEENQEILNVIKDKNKEIPHVQSKIINVFTDDNTTNIIKDNLQTITNIQYEIINTKNDKTDEIKFVFDEDIIDDATDTITKPFLVVDDIIEKKENLKLEIDNKNILSDKNIRDNAINALNSIEKKYKILSVSNIKNFLVDIVIKLLSINDKKYAKIFIDEIPINKLFLHIKTILQEDFEKNNVIAVADQLIKYVNKNFLT